MFGWGEWQQNDATERYTHKQGCQLPIKLICICLITVTLVKFQGQCHLLKNAHSTVTEHNVYFPSFRQTLP